MNTVEESKICGWAYFDGGTVPVAICILPPQSDHPHGTFYSFDAIKANVARALRPDEHVYCLNHQVPCKYLLCNACRNECDGNTYSEDVARILTDEEWAERSKTIYNEIHLPDAGLPEERAYGEEEEEPEIGNYDEEAVAEITPRYFQITNQQPIIIQYDYEALADRTKKALEAIAKAKEQSRG